MNPQLLPCNCHSCGQWTIFEIALVKGGLNMTCSHCSTNVNMKSTQKEAREFISGTRKFMNHLALTNPDVLHLKNPGDHIDPPKSG